MSNRRSRSRLFAIAVSVLLLAGLAGGVATATGTHPTGDPNPPWPDHCGIDAALLIDHSNSIMSNNAANPGLMKDAAKAFADALDGTPSRLAVTSFWKTAQSEIGWTNTDAAGTSAVKTAIDAISFSTNSPNGSTNWDEGFRAVQGLGARVLIILTDGNPTVYLNNYGSGGSTDQVDIDEGVKSANLVKSAVPDGVPTRIVAVGIGSGVTVGNLQLISGPTADDDYFTTNFANLQTKLVEIASKLCGGSVTVEKQVQQPDGSYADASGWQFNASIGGANPPAVVADPADGRTDAAGLVNFKWQATGDKEATVTETVKPGYSMASVACDENGNAYPSTPVANGAKVTLGPTDQVHCLFKNSRDTGSMRITKQLRDAQGAVVVPDQASDTDGASFLVFSDGNANGTYQAGEEAHIWPTNTVAACTVSGGAGFCDVGPLATGTYGVHETAAPAGSTVGSDVFPVVVSKNTKVNVTFVNTLSPLNVTIDKSGPDRAHRGDTVHYTFAASTTGPKLHDIVVAEVGINRCDGAISGPVKVGDSDAFLESGETWNYSCDHVVTAGDPDPLPNTASVTGTDDFGRTVTDSDTHGVDILDPALTVDKKVEGADHKPISSAYVAHPGDVLHYTVAVTNSGDTPMVISALADTLKVNLPSVCTAGIGSTLAVGATITCTYTAVAVDDVHNVASATGVDVLGGANGTKSASDETFVNVVHPAIQLVKSAATMAHPGDSVTYSFQVTNTGDVPLTNASVDDNKLGHIGTIASLAPGASQTLTKTVTAGATDVTNVATVCGDDPLQAHVCGDDDHHLDVINPAIEIVKTGTAKAHEGDTTNYSFAVHNTGDVALTNVSVDDDKLGHIGTIATLAVGATQTLTTTSIAPAADVHNVATACGDDPLQHEVCGTDDHTLDVIHPSIDVVKSGPGSAQEGDVTNYSFSVHNTGDVTLTNVSVDDDVLGHIGDIATLAVGQTVVLNKASTAPADDVRNVGTACGDDPLDMSVCDNDDHTVDVIHPGIDVHKSGPTNAHEGDTVVYTFDVHNTGDVTLAPVTVTDDVLGTIGTIPSLAAGATTTLSKTFTVPASTSAVDNVVTACGDSPLQKEFCDTDEHHLTVVHPAMTLDKKVNGGDHKPVGDALIGHNGDALSYTVLITNTGDTPLTITALDDSVKSNLAGACSSPIGSALAAGDVITCTYTAVAGSGDVHNVASATGVDPLGGASGTTSAADETFVDVQHPSINVDKVGPALVHQGDTITYTFKVTNTGDVGLTNVTVNDDVLGVIGTVASLAPGASETLSKDFTVPADALGIENTATACGVDPSDLTVCDEDPHSSVVIRPDVQIVKTASPGSADPGQEVTYSYFVTNTGNTVLTDVKVTDDKLGDIGTISTLAPGETVTLTRVVTIASDSPRTNIGTACGVDGLGLKVCDTDGETITIVLPQPPQGRPLPHTGFRLLLWVALSMALIGTGLAMVREQLDRKYRNNV